MHFAVFSHNSCKILKGTYASSYEQPQKFGIEREEYGKSGYHYGSLSGANNLYVFGPIGKIYTSQPYLRRVQVSSTDDLSSHPEYSYDTVAANGYVVNTSGVTGDTVYYGNNTDIGHPYRDYLHYENDVDQSEFPWINIAEWPYFYINGNVQGANNLIGILEGCIGRITNESWYTRFYRHPMIDQVDMGDESQRVDVNPYYNVAFHNYGF